MKRTTPFALVTNGTALPWADVPEWPPAELLSHVGAELERGERLSSLFGVPEGGGLRLVAALAFDAGNTLAVGAYFEDGSATGIGGTPDNFAGDAGALYLYQRVC